ncbi:PAS domain-containing sensor histidine kinase [Nafulsella turpanensis]|uniref:PAS domain-containing sensor histidine kinase n=1 Tax=Nafulsella turpanensis TaxID=1265690 RepID=UPI00034665B2|nr:PAS domain-containing sensor histidine kinase [Nafulsella turpanensis]
MQKKDPSGAFHYFKELSENSSKIFFAYQITSNTFSFLNTRFEQLWKQSVDSIKDNPASLLETVHPEDREYVSRSYQQLLKGIKKEEIEFRILPEEENPRWVLVSDPLLIKGPAGEQAIIGMAEDITAAKENYAVLEKFASRKNSILEILSHDLAGPLNNIKTASALLADEIKQYQNPELEKFLDIISQTSSRSIRMIREFVKQEFLASANSAFVKKRVNIVERIHEIIDQYRNSEEEVAKTFEYTTSEEEIYIEVDDYKFGQAINNLISNSIKFTPDGGIISVSIEEQPEHVLFTVADNGIGIPEKFHDTIFEKFTKARRPGLKGEPSTGMGMSIIKTIVEWHGGTVWLESKENEGTTVYIQLPKQ